MTDGENGRLGHPPNSAATSGCALVTDTASRSIWFAYPDSLSYQLTTLTRSLSTTLVSSRSTPDARVLLNRNDALHVHREVRNTDVPVFSRLDIAERNR